MQPDTDRPLAAAIGVGSAALLGFLSLGVVLPVLPRYVTGPLGDGAIAVGVVTGAFAVTAVVSRPFAGGEADRRGRRLIAVIGLSIVGVAGALLFVPAGLAGLIAARLVLGVGDGFMFTACAVWVVDLAPAGRRAQVLGLFGLAVWSGLALGSLAGELLLEHAGYDAVWAFATVCPLVGALIARSMPEPPRPQGAWQGREWLPRPAIVPGISLLLLNIGYATVAGFVVLLLADRDIGRAGAIFTVYAGAVVLARLLLGRLPDRLGGRRTAVGATLAAAAGLAGLAVAGSFWVAALGAVITGIGSSLAYPSLALLVIDRVEDARRGVALGAFTGFFDVGVAVGGPLAGLVAATSGYGAAFWVAAGCSIGAAAVAAGSGLVQIGGQQHIAPDRARLEPHEGKRRSDPGEQPRPLA